jgi:hypothetical protein
MCKLDGHLSIVRCEDDGSLFASWEVVDQTVRSLLGLANPHINVVRVVEY